MVEVIMQYLFQGGPGPEQEHGPRRQEEERAVAGLHHHMPRGTSRLMIWPDTGYPANNFA